MTAVGPICTLTNFRLRRRADHGLVLPSLRTRLTGNLLFPLEDREVADSPLEQAGFELPVPLATVVGAVVLRNEALNWTPCVRSLVQDPLGRNELAGPDHRGVADEGHEIALATGFDPQHAEVGLAA